MATTNNIQFGDGLGVTDLGSGVIRVDSAGATGPTGPTGPAGPAGPAGPTSGNVDGGDPVAVYGGISPIDGGTP